MRIESEGQNIGRQPEHQPLPYSPSQTASDEDIPPPSTAQTTAQNESTTIGSLEQDIRGGERWLIGIGIATLLINSIIALIYWGQLKQMTEATRAATESN